MFYKPVNFFKNFDWVIFFAVFLLVCFGLIELYSIGSGRDTFDLLNFKKQIVFAAVGFALMIFFAFLDYNVIRGYTIHIYLAGLALLAGVLLFGETIRNTRGWFYFGEFSLQPVEFAKVFLVIFLARYFSTVSVRLRPFKHFIATGLGALLFVGLVLLQPDFGSAVVLLLIWLIFIAAAGFSRRYFMVLFILLAVAFAGSWFFLFEDYQKDRVLTYFNPQRDSLERGYNIAQAMVAVGSGRLMGRGIGFGSQSQLKFLPEAQNDFMYAAICEEFGFFGAGLVVFLYCAIFFRLLIHIRRMSNNYCLLFLYGTAGLIFTQMFINIGMNIGLLPVIGISLPFVSYGGSALVASMVLIGLAQSVIIRNRVG